MTDVFIHVGLPRTGTTFLQKAVFPNIENVNLIRDAMFNCRIKKDKINIISNESLSVFPSVGRDVGDRYVVADRLHKLFPNSKIIIGVRGKVSWVKSLYSVYVMSGGVYSFEEYVDKLFNFDFLDYDVYINYLKKLFDDVFVYNLEDLKKNNLAVVSRLCDFIGVDVPEYDNLVWNRSYNDRQLRIMRKLNRYIITDLNENGGFINNFIGVFVLKHIVNKLMISRW